MCAHCTGFNVLLKSQSNDAKLRGVMDESAVKDKYGRWFFAKVRI